MGQIEMLDKNIMEACRLYVDNLKRAENKVFLNSGHWQKDLLL